MIEKNPDYNPSRRTMIELSNALGVPPSVLFFPEEEIEKRQMLSNLVLFCMDSLHTDEQTILKTLQDMTLSIRPIPTLPHAEPPLYSSISEKPVESEAELFPLPPPLQTVVLRETE